MYILERSLRFMRGALTSYGPSILKKAVWDREYSAGQWSFNDNTADDCVYPHLEKYARNGSILDIGCGSGNTANELAVDRIPDLLGRGHIRVSSGHGKEADRAGWPDGEE